MRQEVHWVNGSVASTIEPTDRGLTLGDGVFETIRIEEGERCLWFRHRARLLRGLECLQFTQIGDLLARCEADCQEALRYLRQHNWVHAVLRLTVTRGPSARGYQVPRQTVPTVLISAYRIAAWENQPPPLHLAIAQTTWMSTSVTGGCKTLGRTEQVLAAIEQQARGVDDLLLLDAQGHVACATAANVFCRFDQQVVTPRLHKTGVLGTRREQVIDIVSSFAEYQVLEMDLTPDALGQANEIFLTNAIRGLQSVGQLESWIFSDTTLADRLRPTLHRELV